MSYFTKTGLLPCLISSTPPVKRQKDLRKPTLTLLPSDFTVPAPIRCRPFLQDQPFSNSCSIFCNHPTSKADRKELLLKRKEHLSMNQINAIKGFNSSSNISEYKNSREYKFEDGRDQVFVPEILFRKYMQTDSRPQTPSAVLIPSHTNGMINKQMAAHPHTRKCLTPNDQHLLHMPKKAHILLDLQKSSSQNSLNLENIGKTQGSGSTSVTKITNNKHQFSYRIELSDPKVPPITKNNFFSEMVKYKNMSKSRFKETNNDKKNTIEKPAKNAINYNQEKKTVNMKYKGDKTRKPKSKRIRKASSGIEVTDSNDTCMTQILNNEKTDSRKENCDPETYNICEQNVEGSSICNLDLYNKNIYEILKNIDANALLSHLNTEKYCCLLKRALTPKVIRPDVGEKYFDIAEAPNCRSHFNPKTQFNQQVLFSQTGLSRIISRRSVRFELPLDKMQVIGMKPSEYLKHNVDISKACRISYRKVFNQFTSAETHDLDVGKVYIKTLAELMDALALVLGNNFSSIEAATLSRLLDFKPENQLQIDLQTWYGICALSERIFNTQLSFRPLSKTENPCHEIENADFEFLEEKFVDVFLNETLREILFLIRDA